jgi:hypothetical protein
MLDAISGSVKIKSIDKNIENFMNMPQPEFLDLVAGMKGFEAGNRRYICRYPLRSSSLSI